MFPRLKTPQNKTTREMRINRFQAIYTIVCALLISCAPKIPVIQSIDPKIGAMGEEITLTGKNFGEAREESYVTIAGIAPTNSSYQKWQDNIIKVKFPESSESGLVYVHVKGKKSNGVLFSNSAAVPRRIEGEEPGLEPRIISVNPVTAAAGSLITITGNNFGSSRENGGVFFSWDFDSPSSPFIAREPEFIEVSDVEFGYVSWNAREIRVRLPDGAVSGTLEIRTPRGKSRPFFFDAGGRQGTKAFKDKRSYTVHYSVDVRVTEATRPNTLYLWMPKPVISPSQRNVSLVSQSAAPFVENHRGVSLFKIDNLGPGSNPAINLSFNVEVYAQETVVRPQSIRQDDASPLAAYIQNSNLIPAGDPKIKTLANAIAGRERNPYQKARLFYEWITAEMKITDAPTNIIAAVEQKKADAYTAALLYCAMMRAGGIPCIPVAGVLVNRSGQTLRHYWTEFWIDGFGWIPADPVMGAGAAADSFVIKQEPAGYYFGNLDSQRIAFSRGEVVLSQMESRGRLVSRPQSYSLQNIWEEAAGGLESYSSLWGDITITGIYVQ
ncbi:MAG: IPT/TIG domain-containing protein [Treponema sp.]|jgi:transglutaminase-like putative cysteine protease|nr:IPT/TIG domain-containing protein [Treponema sp.]